MSLGAGQAILFAPNDLGMRSNESPIAQSDPSDSSSKAARIDSDTGRQIPAPIGQGYLHVQSRLRITRDGGHSILAVPDSGAIRLGHVPGRSQIIDVHENENMEHGISGTSSLAGSVAAEATDISPFQTKTMDRSGDSGFDVQAPPFVSSSSLPRPFPSQPDTTAPSRQIEISVLIDYLTRERDGLGVDKVSMDQVIEKLNRGFPTLSVDELRGVVHRVTQDGLVIVISKTLLEWVMLASPAENVPAGSIRPSAPLAQETSAPLPGQYYRHPNATSNTSCVHASSSTVPTTRVITCTGKQSHLLPLIKYIQAVHGDPNHDTSQGLSVNSIKTHFETFSPGLYESQSTKKLKAYKRVASEAIAAGLLVSTKGTPGTSKLSRVTLVPGAQYSL